MQVHAGTCGYMRVHAGTRGYMQVHAGTCRYVRVQYGTRGSTRVRGATLAAHAANAQTWAELKCGLNHGGGYGYGDARWGSGLNTITRVRQHGQKACDFYTPYR